jgi:succinoglycan biosynthesis transport protein ExoP
MAPPKSNPVRPEFMPLSIVRMLWKQKICMIVAGLLGTTAAVVAVRRLPVVYRSEALISIDSQKIPDQYVASVKQNPQQRLSALGLRILSSARLSRIIEDFDLYQDSRMKPTRQQDVIVAEMRKDIYVTPEAPLADNVPVGSFRVAYEGSSPVVVAEVTNRLANLFIEGNLRQREVEAEGTSQFLDSHLDEAKQRLTQMEARLSRYKLQHQGELPSHENALVARQVQLSGELQRVQDDIGRARQDKFLLAAQIKNAEATLAELAQVAEQRLPPTPALDVSKTDRLPAPLRSESETLQQQLEQLRFRYSDEHPEVQRLKMEIERLQTLEKQRKAGQPARRTNANKSTDDATQAKAPAAVPSPEASRELILTRERLAGLRTQLAARDQDLATQEAERKRVLGQINDLRGRIGQLPIREREMADLTRDYEMSKTSYQSLLDKKMSAGMAADMEKRQQAEKFTLIEPAHIPLAPLRPNRRVLYGAALVFGLFLSLALPLGMELKKNVFLGEWELPADLLVLGRVSRIEIHPTDGSTLRRLGWRRRHGD